MNDRNFTINFTVDQTPEAAFAAINNVRGWWSEDVVGSTDKLGETFNYRYKDVHRCTVKVTELIPGKRVSWHILENYFSFTEDRSEWTDTNVVFDIAKKDGKTEIRLTHQGLVPEYECYDICSDGWSTYIKGSLRNLITTGKGQPNVGQPLTESERELTA